MISFMHIRKCTVQDAKQLAVLNKQLIEDEKSDNTMTLQELKERMQQFLTTEYDGYFFMEENEVVGYALVKHTVKPLYLRQFLIERTYRRQHLGLQAFELLMKELGTASIDIEVLSWNERGRKFWERCGFAERSRYMRFDGEKK